MNNKILAACFAILAGCNNLTDAQHNSPGLSVVAGSCANSLTKVTSNSAKLTYATKDSIGFVFNVTLNCDAKYVYRSTLIGRSTIDFSVEDIGDIRAKCVCARDLTINLKSVSGEDYSSVRTLVFYTDTINLSLP